MPTVGLAHEQNIKLQNKLRQTTSPERKDINFRCSRTPRGEAHRPMAVKEKLRWEILRRDNFACRYCGATAEGGAILQIDHVVPRSRGGKDVPQNLLTACRDCNSGKSDTPLDAPTIEDVPQADFRRLCAVRYAPPARDSAEYEDFEIEAAVAWSHGWNPGVRGFGEYSVELTLAVAAGRGRQEIVDACVLAGRDQSSNIGSYMSWEGQVGGGPEEDAQYDWAHEYLRRIIPTERCKFIWSARDAAGSYRPNETELICAAGTIARDVLEEHGRDHDELRRWLGILPNQEGEEYLAAAAQEWDDVWQGARGHASHECPGEVLEIAVSRALGAEVPA